jgi:hypothetical protein
MFFSSVRVPRVSLADGADGDVRVAAEAPLLHVAVADTREAHDLVQGFEIRDGFVRAAEVRLADDLDERHPGPIQVDERGPGGGMDRLAGVLLEVDAADADLAREALDLDGQAAELEDGRLVLGDLVALGEVRVEVVFPCKHARRPDSAIEREAGDERERHGVAVQHGHHAGETEAYRTGVFVHRRAEGRRAAAEELLWGQELAVNLETDDGLPTAVHRETSWPLKGSGGRRAAEPVASS